MESALAVLTRAVAWVGYQAGAGGGSVLGRPLPRPVDEAVRAHTGWLRCSSRGFNSSMLTHPAPDQRLPAWVCSVCAAVT